MSREVFENLMIGNAITLNDEDYPGLGDWWVQLRIGPNRDEVLARIYGSSGQEVRERAEIIRDALLKQTTCQWTSCMPEDDYHDTWEGSCGATWVFFEAGPKDNGMHFCPKCGGSVAIRKSKVDGDASKTE